MQQQGRTKMPRVYFCTVLWVVVVMAVLSTQSFDENSDVGVDVPPSHTAPPYAPPQSNSPPRSTIAIPQPPRPFSTPVPIVHHLLDHHAQQKNLPHELKSKHCAKCRPKKGNVSLPHFCQSHAPGSNHGVKYDFNKEEGRGEGYLTAIPPGPLPLVLCAIGQRFHGPGGQSYVWYNIIQVRKFNPPETMDIYLALADSIADEANTTNLAEIHKVKVVRESELRTSEWQAYLDVFYIQGYMHPGGNRQTGHKKFNQHVSERFYTLLSIIQKYNLEHVLHLENDVLLYSEWRPVLEAIAACQVELGSTVPSLKGIIPGVLYIRNAASLRLLTQFITDLLSCGPSFGESLQAGYANDMTYLMNYYQYFGSRKLFALPAWEHAKGENCIYDRMPHWLWDAASFGQWYSFSPPGGKMEPPKHIRNAMKGRFLDATPPEYMTWEVDEKGRKYPKWKGYRLLSLHIHAKNLWRFLS